MIASRLLPLVCLLAALGATAPASAQSSSTGTAPVRADRGTPAAPRAGAAGEQRVEEIRHEDAGSRIDELRVGGETRTITVQPKNGSVPAYEITPPSNNVNPSNTDHNNQGGSRWKILSY